MAKCKLLAFLLCQGASRGKDGKATLEGLFDRIIAPRDARPPWIFFVFYKVVVEQPCTLTLKVVELNRSLEIPGFWRDFIGQIGPIQSVWALATAQFRQPGRYALELRQESDVAEAISLATTLLVVDEQDG